MKPRDLPTHYRAALSFGAPTLLLLLAIPILFREGRSRAVDSHAVRGGAIKALEAIRAEDASRQPAVVPSAPSPEPEPDRGSSPLPRAPEELSASAFAGAAAHAPTAAPAAPALAAAAPAASASMPAHGASVGAGFAPPAGAASAAAAGPAMGGSAGAPSYKGGQMGQVQGYDWKKPKLKVVESKYGSQSGAPDAPSSVSSISGSAIAGGGASTGGGGGPSFGASPSGGFGSSGMSAFGGGGPGGGGMSFPAGDSEGPDDFGMEDVPDLPAAQPLRENATLAEIEAANRQCQRAAQAYSGPLESTGNYLSSLRGCDSKRCKRRAKSACSRLNAIDCRAKRACPTTATQACGNSCDV